MRGDISQIIYHIKLTNIRTAFLLLVRKDLHAGGLFDASVDFPIRKPG